MSDVRTTAGWIGVEISRSRVRTPGKAGYGLYRVRGSVARSCGCDRGRGEHVWIMGEWTAYAFTLDDVRAAVEEAISRGTPAGPGELRVRQAYPGKQAAIVPTRWTQAYRGRRDLGVAVPVTLKPEAVQRVSALAALVDEGLIEMRHDPQWCGCSGTARLTMRCVDATMGNVALGPVVRAVTARQRQRESNAAFQSQHKRERDWGLTQRYAEKSRRNEQQQPREGV